MRFADKHGAGEIHTLPGCSQVAVSCFAFVSPRKRGKGHGKKLHDSRFRKMKSLLYDFAICTVDASNEAQIKILKSREWRRMATFRSQRTGHEVHLYGKHL